MKIHILVLLSLAGSVCSTINPSQQNSCNRTVTYQVQHLYQGCPKKEPSTDKCSNETNAKLDVLEKKHEALQIMLDAVKTQNRAAMNENKALNIIINNMKQKLEAKNSKLERELEEFKIQKEQLKERLTRVENNATGERIKAKTEWEQLKIKDGLLEDKMTEIQNNVKNISIGSSVTPRKACNGCDEGHMIRGVSNSQLSASSVYTGDHGPDRSRLHTTAAGSKVGAWCSGRLDTNQWIQVDFQRPVRVTYIATQGRSDCCKQWVTSYAVKYSNDGNNWTMYKEGGSNKVFCGNWDENTRRKHQLLEPFDARFVRLEPSTWHVWISMRWEIYGCPLMNN